MANPQLEGIAMALQGMQAGIQGSLPAFNQQIMQQQEMQRLEEERRRQAEEQRMMTQFTDANAALQLLDQGNLDGVVQLGMNRLELLSNFPDANPEDTQRLTQLAAAARNGDSEAEELLRKELESNVQIGRSLGVLEAPEAERLSSSEVIDGQVVEVGPDGTPRARQIEGFQQQTKAPTPYSELAKIEADRRAGLLTDDQANLLLSQATEGPAGAREDDVRDRRINDYMEVFGMSRADAIEAVDSDLRTDPTTGVLSLYNPVDGSQKVIEPNIQRSEAGERPTRKTTAEDLAFDPQKGTGFGASFLGAYNSTLGQLPFLPVARGPEEAAQSLRLLERDSINALASSGRPPVVEQERITSMMPKPMDWTENPQVAEWKMTNFIDLMMNQYVDDLRYQDDLTNPRAIRDESRNRANEVESIIRRVLTPDAADEMFRSINRVEQEIGDIRQMNASDLLSLDPANLTDAELDVYLQRMDEL